MFWVAYLVTKNIRDFGVRKLATLGIEVQRPDAFLSGQIANDEASVAAAFAALRSSPTLDRLLERLAADGQTDTAAALLAAWQAGALPVPGDARSCTSRARRRSRAPVHVQSTR